jgi:hypothetical protein
MMLCASPAEAAGLTDKVMPIEDLAALIDAAPDKPTRVAAWKRMRPEDQLQW